MILLLFQSSQISRYDLQKIGWEKSGGPNRENWRRRFFGTRLLFLHFAHLAARCICNVGENETRVETAEGEKKMVDQKQKYVDQG